MSFAIRCMVSLLKYLLPKISAFQHFVWMLKFPVQLQRGPGQMYRGEHVQQGRGACTRLCWLWRQVSRHLVLGDHQDLCPGCPWWRLPCGERSSPTWNLAGVTLWRFPAGRFLSMSSKWKSFSLRYSFRIGTNDSVDQIFLFLHHHFLYHVYVHDPRLNQLFYISKLPSVSIYQCMPISRL